MHYLDDMFSALLVLSWVVGVFLLGKSFGMAINL